MSSTKNDLSAERDFYFAFAYCDLFGVKNLEKIRVFFGSWARAWQKPAEALAKIGFSEKLCVKFSNFQKDFSWQATEKLLALEDLRYLLFLDSEYPNNLKNISSPPPIIFYRGDISILEKQKDFCLAIVGSRQTSAYGEKALDELISGLDERFLIVSGLALGTDANAHRGALRLGLKTCAVLGGPLDQETFSCPSDNYGLAQEILQNGGCLLSEFPLGTPIGKSNYPRRNRIIAGLCPGTLVIEAGEKSGASKTASYAIDANRAVMAVPGSIYSPLSLGTNNLLKNHADAVTEAADIYYFLGLKRPAGRKNSGAKKAEILAKAQQQSGENGLIIAKYLLKSGELATVDEISELSQLDTPCVHSTLTILELAGIVVRNSRGQFSLK